MVYKRSKTLYLSFLAGIALIAGITHAQPADQGLTVVVSAAGNTSNSSQLFAVSETAAPQIDIDQNYEIDQTDLDHFTLLDQ